MFVLHFGRILRKRRRTGQRFWLSFVRPFGCGTPLGLHNEGINGNPFTRRGSGFRLSVGFLREMYRRTGFLGGEKSEMPYVVGSESEIGKNSLFGDKHTHLYDLRSLFKELRPASLGKSSPDGMKCLPRMGEETLSWVSCSRAIGQEERMRQFLKLKNGGEFLHKGGKRRSLRKKGAKKTVQM